MKQFFSTVSKPNILLIVVDSLKSDKCINENLTSITPNIDFLIKNGAVFPQTISPAAVSADSEKRISIKDFKLNEFLKTEGWVTIKANNPYVTGYYFNMNSSGSVSGDHFF